MELKGHHVIIAMSPKELADKLQALPLEILAVARFSSVESETVYERRSWSEADVNYQMVTVRLEWDVELDASP